LLDRRKLELQVPVAVSVSPRIAYCDWWLISADGKRRRKRSVGTPAPHSDSVVFIASHVTPTPVSLYPQNALRRIGGFREGLPCAQEFDLNLRLACSGAEYHHFPQPLVTVRKVAGSVSGNTLKRIDQWQDILWRAFADLRQHGTITDARAAAFATRMARGGRTYLRYGQFDKAKLCFQDAARMHPSGGLSGAYGKLGLLSRAAVGPVITEWLTQAVRQPKRVIGLS
jgi:hypothetical protein